MDVMMLAGIMLLGAVLGVTVSGAAAARYLDRALRSEEREQITRRKLYAHGKDLYDLAKQLEDARLDARLDVPRPRRLVPHHIGAAALVEYQ